MNRGDSPRDYMRFIGITKDATTAGPGKRLEFFLKGCIRGIVNPCEGCFNPTTWEFSGPYKRMHVQEVINLTARDAWNRQVTFCGGEPLLQTRNLIRVCKALKEIDARFHIVVYTAYTIENLFRNGIRYRLRKQDDPAVQETLLAYSREWNRDKDRFVIATTDDIRELMKHIDILVDGDYQHDKRIPVSQYMDEQLFVGSYNQRVIDAPSTLEHEPDIVFEYADVYQREFLKYSHCRCCGHVLKNPSSQYCDEWCQETHQKRQKQLNVG